MMHQLEREPQNPKASTISSSKDRYFYQRHAASSLALDSIVTYRLVINFYA
jgi:hypothetical protein